MPLKTIFRDKQNLLILGLVGLKLLIHFATNHRYGFHRDELYFIACGEHLDWGYVDHSPMIALIAKVSGALFGDSVRALRVFPALAGGALMGLVCLMVRELGGKMFATLLAGVCLLVAPLYLRANGMLNIVTFDQLLWVLSAYLLMRWIRTGRSVTWVWLGVVMGLGLLTKHSMLFFGFGLFVGLLATPHRKEFLKRNAWIAAGIALALFLPNLIWQAQHGWPTLEFLRNINAKVMNDISRPEFAMGQILYLSPNSFPIWLAGLGYFLFAKKARPYRLFGWIYVAVFVLLFTVKSKVYYLGPAYPALFAGGACWIEGWLSGRGKRIARPALITFVLAGGIMLAPISVPVLSIEGFGRYTESLSAILPDSHEVAADYYDMHGWEEQVEAVARAFDSLPEEDRDRCAILGSNYGHAGAVDRFGGEYGLPKAISGHNSYYHWGPGDWDGNCVVSVGRTPEDLAWAFNEVTLVEIVRTENALDEEVPICVCRGLKIPVAEAWERMKAFN